MWLLELVTSRICLEVGRASGHCSLLVSAWSFLRLSKNEGLGFRVSGLGFRFRVSGFRVWV